MTRRILVPVDDSPRARDALEFVLSEHAGDDIVLLHVLDPITAIYVSEPSVWDDEMIDRRRERAAELLEELRGEAERADGTVTTVIEHGDPSRVIVESARENEIDQIVIGSHGRSGVSRVLLGSVAETVARRSPVPVTIVR
ncbi:universal stress protein [Halalkalicoccus sp. NIPERK01]|uniref:universal stress protein n=1 Tax=Halalkalicoccus sp. NIPERK01 TaxID=3053469 RepID=UPI00256F41B6|nr:universal stress protein [Halalkalicoccus sp. NIPERK01]MDL5360593.1 universal stress protein [Halalkalicoccus sp. NIPERK01]